eukprot:CAMPEP_0184656148 /NCGR_PEP_ID=MMETSP0308-20130426/15786_1 /TAXON_ID=38269 /ORGANISM="Gloeochaete witrockiana, Strain SAG 46.84" /LENGTH=157 /DNA_ID=CAMNT_0027093117 /DNA_START=20 /DNA_END=490 /DNA_ORIENTATION=-
MIAEREPYDRECITKENDAFSSGKEQTYGIAPPLADSITDLSQSAWALLCKANTNSAKADVAKAVRCSDPEWILVPMYYGSLLDGFVTVLHEDEFGSAEIDDFIVVPHSPEDVCTVPTDKEVQWELARLSQTRSARTLKAMGGLASSFSLAQVYFAW